MRILVVLPNWFGETLFTTPFLRALRRCRPEAWIATLGRPACREVLLHSPHVNAILDYDEGAAHAGLAGHLRLVRMLRQHRFDAAYILRRSLKRTALLAAAGIRDRIGFANRKSGWLLTTRVRPAGADGHKAASYLPLLAPAGCAGEANAFDYEVTETELAGAKSLLEREGLLDGRPLIVLHPGANWAHKRWPPERFAAVGDRLSASHGARIAVTGGPDDRGLAEAIRTAMTQPAAVLAGRTSVRQLAACLTQARLFISNDTGILHIAAALGRPLVGLYGPTSPAWCGPLGEPGRIRIVHHAESCPTIPCYEEVHEGYPGMESITVDEVCEAATQLLRQET
jgi:heptosyltransferase-2